MMQIVLRQMIGFLTNRVYSTEHKHKMRRKGKGMASPDSFKKKCQPPRLVFMVCSACPMNRKTASKFMKILMAIFILLE